MDKDISSGIENMAVAEQIIGKKWKWDGESYKNPSRHNAVTPFYAQGSTLEDDIRTS
jgi:hypothetical protein